MVFLSVSATGLSVLVFVFASGCHTCELEAVLSFKPLATGLSVRVSPYGYGLISNCVL